jgi:hypothetical protein
MQLLKYKCNLNNADSSSSSGHEWRLRGLSRKNRWVTLLPACHDSFNHAMTPSSMPYLLHARAPSHMLQFLDAMTPSNMQSPFQTCHDSFMSWLLQTCSHRAKHAMTPSCHDSFKPAMISSCHGSSKHAITPSTMPWLLHAMNSCQVPCMIVHDCSNGHECQALQRRSAYKKRDAHWQVQIVSTYVEWLNMTCMHEILTTILFAAALPSTWNPCHGLKSGRTWPSCVGGCWSEENFSFGPAKKPRA